jgi:hypothetical protein
MGHVSQIELGCRQIRLALARRRLKLVVGQKTG